MLGLSAVLVVVVVVIVVLWWARRESPDDRLSEEWGFEAVTDEQAAATREFLAGDGAPLLDLADLADRLAAQVAEASGSDEGPRCADLVEQWDRFYGGVGAEGIGNLLAELPDPTLGRLWEAQASILAENMWLCGDPDLVVAADESLRQVADLQEAVNLRLDDLEVRR